MSHQKIIQDLIAWIDEHIDQPLNIDVVAKKSGYSKWYLQRMFRTVTHQTLITFASAVCYWPPLSCAPPSVRFLISQWTWVMSLSRPSPAFSVGSLIALPAIIATACSFIARALIPARVIAPSIA